MVSTCTSPVFSSPLVISVSFAFVVSQPSGGVSFIASTGVAPSSAATTTARRSFMGRLLGWASWWSVQRGLPQVELRLGLLAAQLVQRHQLADHLLAVSLGLRDVVFGQPAPLLAHLAFDLLPLRFHAVVPRRVWL